MDVKGADHTREISSLKRIEGQVRGIIKMVEEERYCIDILTQFKAVFAALGKVEIKILEGHIENCVKDAIGDDEKKVRALLDELIAVVKKTGRRI